MTKPSIAYIAEGKLYTQGSTGDARLVESAFVQTILDRAEKNRERNDWKSGNMAWQLSGRALNPMGISANTAELRKLNFMGLAAGPSVNDLYYTIDTDYACGLFHHELAEGYERRIYHRNQFRVSDLARCAETGNLAFAVRSPDGTTHLATMPAEGRGFKEITEGDAVDEAPSWVPGEKNTLLFQSAGIGRNQHGGFTGLSPYAIQKIDLDSGKMTMVIDQDNQDVLLPRQSIDGSIYFIRRPYQPFGSPVSPWRLMLDLLLFPFRLTRAIAHFLNIFSLIFTKKPLMTAGGPPREGPDQNLMMLYGRLIDARKIAQSNKGGTDQALVPASWVLVRRSPDGAESILAKSALAFDLCRDESVIYTNGSRIYQVTAAGETHEIGRGKLIERVAALGA
jgi:hypothetical protein